MRMSDELTDSRWGASARAVWTLISFPTSVPHSLRGPLELRLVLATRQDLRLGLHQLRLEASSCSAQELTAPDTEQSCHRPRVP